MILGAQRRSTSTLKNDERCDGRIVGGIIPHA